MHQEKRMVRIKQLQLLEDKQELTTKEIMNIFIFHEIRHTTGYHSADGKRRGKTYTRRYPVD
ncbi:hypothetical protein OYT88_17195 [Sporolactobacillus sp. CQH2019]|nr:hypothetical protein [Sporolactobacillus sp. CQH2019]MDD9150275.1 hypothetical protein [Sporolactobacillus sp. CQH2019]